jgi:hypothetical protein
MREVEADALGVEPFQGKGVDALVVPLDAEVPWGVDMGGGVGSGMLIMSTVELDLPSLTTSDSAWVM